MEKFQKLIEAKQFDKVIELLSHPQDEIAYKYLILAHFGKGDFNRVIEIVDLALTKDNKNYYWLIRYKIEALIEMQQLENASNVVEQELKMPYIPKDYVEYFTTLGSQLKNQIKLKNKKDQLSSLDDASFIELLLKETDEMNLLVLVDQFSYRNVRAMIDGLKRFYDLERIPSYIKMSLTEVLKEQALDFEFKIRSNNQVLSLNPMKIQPLFEQDNFKQAIKTVDDNPLKLPVSQKEIIYELIITYLANLFPKFLITEDIGTLVAASMILSNEMLAVTNKAEPILHYTGAKWIKVEPLIKQLKLLI